MWDWEYRVFVREFLSRVLRAHLSPSEWCVLDFIFDRTLQWGKQWETIRLRQFVGGSLPDANGFQAFCGCGLGERAVREACHKLRDAGLIEIRDKPNGNGLREFSITRADVLIHRIEAWELPAGQAIRYRTRWPGTETIVEVRSRDGDLSGT